MFKIGNRGEHDPIMAPLAGALQEQHHKERRQNKWHHNAQIAEPHAAFCAGQF